MSITDLPALNAGLNSVAALLLLAGYVCIRRGNKDAHRNCMVAAFVTSTLFLISYLTYHYYTETLTRFVEPAQFRPIYLVILLTHTVLATVLVPMVLLTMYRAMRGQFEKHRRIARWTWPVWIYVSVTGVLIYLLLYQIFPQSS
jgi:putative membrane protein